MRLSKQEAKRERKAEREQKGEVGPEMGEAQEVGPPPGQWEWFSPSRSRVVQTAEGQRPNEAPDDWILMTEAEEKTDGGSEASGEHA